MLVRLVISVVILAVVRPVDSNYRPHFVRRKKHLHSGIKETDLFLEPIKKKTDTLGPQKSVASETSISRAATVSASLSKNHVDNGIKTIECDPRAGTKPDVGILSCDAGSICVKNKDSTLGGVCSILSKSRVLQEEANFVDVCLGTASPEEVGAQSCDCSQFDGTSGIFTCVIFDRYCFTSTGTYCGSITHVEEVSCLLASKWSRSNACSCICYFLSYYSL